MGAMVYSLLWAMRDLYHEPYPGVTMTTMTLFSQPSVLKDESHAESRILRWYGDPLRIHAAFTPKSLNEGPFVMRSPNLQI